MIKNKEIADKSITLLTQANALIMEALKLVRANCSDVESNEFQEGTAHVVGRLYFLLMEPIYRTHPSLAPPDTPKEFLNAWSKNDPTM